MLLDEFLKNTPKEDIRKLVEEIDLMETEGVSFGQYLKDFEKAYQE